MATAVCIALDETVTRDDLAALAELLGGGELAGAAPAGGLPAALARRTPF